LSLKSIALRGLNTFHRAAACLPSIGPLRPLRGSFSALEALRRGELEGSILMEYQTPGICPPDSMTERAGFQQHDHQPWPVFRTRADDARLVGRMHFWRDPKDRICTEAVFHHPQRRRLGEDRLLAQLIVAKPHRLSGAWTSIASPWCNGGNYFHWMVDGLARLFVRDSMPVKPGILIPVGLPRFAEETLDLLHLREACQTTDHDCIQPERYDFCSPTAMTGVWNPIGFQWLRNAFAPYFTKSQTGPPIFLTRRGRARIPDNLAAIEVLFRKHGFEIVDCGTIPVVRQIELASSASAIAGLHGAAMTNLLWVRPGTPVLEIFQPVYFNACYEQIAFQGNLEYTAEVIEGESPLRQIEDWLAGER
jgi:hypothetical protein